jgi:aspartyl-tRNA(Asn)/glutamyl-tRNA(Gln) amidotransferase subunit A
MPDQSLYYLSITELAAGYRSRQFSPVEVTESYLSRIEQTNRVLGAYITVTAEEARIAAREAVDALLRCEDRGALQGVPLGLKDVVDVAGLPTTAGASFRRDHRAIHDASVTRCLRQAGAVILGKQTLLEVAMGGTDRNPHFGVTPNPWNLDRFAGGSSSGSNWLGERLASLRFSAWVMRTSKPLTGTYVGGLSRRTTMKPNLLQSHTAFLFAN